MNYREAETITADYNTLLNKARAIYEALPESHRSAFYQLVLYPVEACCNLNEMVVAAGKNQLYTMQGRASANAHAEKVRTLFAKPCKVTENREITEYFPFVHRILVDKTQNLPPGLNSILLRKYP